MKRMLTALMAMILSTSMLAACQSNKPEEGSAGSSQSEAKVAAIFGGAINDGNWNETQYNGLLKIKEKGANTSYLENIADADAAESARTYASEGYGLIYLTTNSYQDHCAPIAKDFPNVKFVQINGTLITDNVISVRIADEEQGFMQGVIAALISQTGKVGFVGGMEINPIKLGSSGFQQGVDYVNQNYGTNVEAMRVNTGSFTDVNKAKETAISMIESGCDVVAPMANDASVGIMEAAEEKGVMTIGAGVGQEKSAPTATKVIVVKDVSIAYDVTYDAFNSGQLTASTVETYGANRGVVFLSEWFGDVDSGIKDKVSEIMKKLAAGEISISTQ